MKARLAILAVAGAVLVWFSVAGCKSLAAEDQVAVGIPNLAEVEPGIWRGGQPKTPAAWAYLRALGLTNDIKLNTGEEASDNAAERAGFRVFHFPIDTMQQLVEGPEPAAMSNAVARIGPGTFIHCEHGRDRTGLLVGLYRLKEGTNAAAAWCEMTNHGYHPALLGLTRFWEKNKAESKKQK